MDNNFFSGTSNVVLPVKNKTHFPQCYQDKSRLCYYASLFNSVEVNSSFYKLPLARTVKKWADEVPASFRFTFKLIQTVTHAMKQTIDINPVSVFLERLDTNKRGCLLVQLPPSFQVNIFELGKLMDALNGCGWNVAVEFRHISWYNDNVFQLLYENKAAMVIHDLPKSRTPMELTSDDVIYLRFHGPEGGYRGSYSDSFLAEYATYIQEWLQDGRTVYAYFNNTMGAAVQNLITLNNFIMGIDHSKC